MRQAAIAYLCLFAAGLAALSACSVAAPMPGKIGVAVTILPQVEFVEAVGGSRVSVSAMVPPGASAESYEPAPSQLVTLSQAKAYTKLGSGIDFEIAWMDKLQAANRNMLIIDCSKGIKLIASSEAEHAAGDPHIWLSPANAEIITRNIADGLTQIDPGSGPDFASGRDSYQQKLAALDQDIKKQLSPFAGRAFMVYHPGWGYYARDYNLVELVIEENGHEPTAARLVELIDQARSQRIKTVFISPQFSTRSAQVIADALGGRVETLDDLAQNYIDNLRSVTLKIAASME